MKKHLLSFLKSPVGYAANLAASALQYAGPLDRLLSPIVEPLCRHFCIQDGIQSDALF